MIARPPGPPLGGDEDALVACLLFLSVAYFLVVVGMGAVVRLWGWSA